MIHNNAPKSSIHQSRFVWRFGKLKDNIYKILLRKCNVIWKTIDYRLMKLKKRLVFVPLITLDSPLSAHSAELWGVLLCVHNSYQVFVLMQFCSMQSIVKLGNVITILTSPKCRIYVSEKRVSFGSDNGASPIRSQSIIWTNAGIVFNWTLWNKLLWNLNRNLYIFIQENALKMSPGNFQPFSRLQCVNGCNLIRMLNNTSLMTL